MMSECIPVVARSQVGDTIISHNIPNHHIQKFSIQEQQVRIHLTKDTLLRLSQHICQLRGTT